MSRYAAQKKRGSPLQAGSLPGTRLEVDVLAFGAEFGHRRIGVALFGAVELRDSPEMDLGDANFLVAVLGFLLLLGKEFAITEFALDGQMHTLAERRGESREIPPGHELMPLRAADVAVAVLVLPGRRFRERQHREFTLRLRGFHFRVLAYK